MYLSLEKEALALYQGDVYLQAVEKPFVEPSPIQVVRLRNRLLDKKGSYVSKTPIPDFGLKRVSAFN